MLNESTREVVLFARKTHAVFQSAYDLFVILTSEENKDQGVKPRKWHVKVATLVSDWGRKEWRILVPAKKLPSYRRHMQQKESVLARVKLARKLISGPPVGISVDLSLLQPSTTPVVRMTNKVQHVTYLNVQ